jgi:hypothetical protein
LITIIRSFVSILIFGIFAVPFFLLVSKDGTEEKLILLWMFRFFLPLFFGSFGLYAFGRLIFFKLNLVNENSIGKMYELEEDDDEDIRT